MASKFILNLARIEEGRRYLNFNSKITNDIKRTLKKKSKQLESLTVDYLNDILNLLNPVLDRNINVIYYFKAEEGNSPLQTQHTKVQNNKGNNIKPKDSIKSTIEVRKKNPMPITYLIGRKVSYYLLSNT